MPERGFAVSAGLEPETAAALARRCAELGYESIWSNDHAAAGPPSGSGLETLAALEAGAAGLTLGAAGLALDRHSPATIAADVERLSLPTNRLAIAVDAGRASDPEGHCRAALPELRGALPGVRLLLAAVGPRMCQLGGEAFDGVLVAWMTPALIAEARRHIAVGAARAGRPSPPLSGVVRASVGADAETRLAREEGFYRGLPGDWRAHFAQLADDPGRTGVFADYADGVTAGLEPYERALDALVVRGLAAARLPNLGRIAAAAAPQAAGASSATSSSVSRETTAPNAK